MVTIDIKNTKTYTGSIMVDNIIVKSLSQDFDVNGKMSGSMAGYIIEKELYYKYISECRNQEDIFIKKMREIEDLTIKETSVNTEEVV